MQRWQTFLNSWNTPGGNMLLLFIFVFSLLLLVLHLLHHSGDANITTVITTTFAGFAGALLKALSGRTSDVPAPPGMTTTNTSTQQASATPAVKP